MVEFKRYLLLLISVLFFTIAGIQETLLLNHHPEVELIKKFQHELRNQELKLDTYLDKISKTIDTPDFNENYIRTFQEYNNLLDKQGLGILISKENRLVYWSDNYFAFSPQQHKELLKERLVSLPNGVFITKSIESEGAQITGLIRLKTKFRYENKFLKNEFTAPFKLPDDFQIISEKYKYAHEIYDQNGHYLMSVFPGGKIHCNYNQLYFPSLLYLLGFIFLLLFIRKRIREYEEEIFILKMLVLAAILFSIYWIHTLFGIPSLITIFGLFSPTFYAYSQWLPSLGDFLLITVLFFFWSLIFIEEYSFPKSQLKIAIPTSFLFVGALYVSAGMLMQNVILNSNIAFELFRINDINLFSVCSYLSFAILLFSIFLINLKILERTHRLIDRKKFLLYHLAGLLSLIILSFVLQNTVSYMLILFIAVNFFHSLLPKMEIKRFSVSYTILFISFFSIISLLLVYKGTKERDIQTQKLMAVNLSSEHDPIAEVIITNMQKQVSTDSIIPRMLYSSYEDLENYLTRTYFNGYFRRYDIQYTICTGSDSVLIQPEEITEPCFPFFENMINRSGNKIPGTNFYYMDNMNGRTSYFGLLHYPLTEESAGISIFIELNSKTISEGIGFPELLMEKSMVKPERYKYFSYAKYFNNELVKRSGDYSYNYFLQSYNLSDSQPEFKLYNWDGFDHMVYHPEDKNFIIVSNRSIRFLDFLISFPYIFVFYFVFTILITSLGDHSIINSAIPRDLRFRIQAAIISVVLISLILVAAGTIFYNIREYRNRHLEDLREKLQSITQEVESQLVNSESITPELQEWLFRDLYRLSNTFAADINIYGLDGELLASSRPEIFQKGIVSQRMNANAFYELSENFQLNIVMPEQIGHLSYLSAYEPIINNRGKYIGFLNLPYFTREDELKQEISTFIVAFINLYVLLFITSVLVAIFLSNQITRPLSLIRDKLRGIQLGKKGEQINYAAEDEIGELVKEYNQKVGELAESAELLAKSERESAWREMAKQIAHEIKNPLTPMKLNIQYLQRAKIEKSDRYDEYFDKVTKSLIEQIDTLSEIATEFSNFAKIPKAKSEVFNLIDILRNVCGLFESGKNYDFAVEMNGHEEINVKADHEQLSRAIINLIKNAIQAIPSERKGKIDVQLKKKGNMALIFVKDNGTGIPEALREQLFQPNFTTKTSGMGLGLAIVKNITDNFGGQIWYQTEYGKGSTFCIEIPIHS